MTPYDRLARLGLTLPKAVPAQANYMPWLLRGNQLHVSGQGPFDASGQLRTGKVGRDRTTDEAYDDARITGLNLLAQVHAAVGDLGRVAHVLKVFGMVNATDDFRDHPKVINGCSDLFVAVLGEAGGHTRSAVGMGSLPMGISVEIEASFEIAM
ncbi:MAG: RidA family protein [Xanthobacteraceae bacterium]|nr:RidA family protein [Xanthobacteraceae bacterium]